MSKTVLPSWKEGRVSPYESDIFDATELPFLPLTLLAALWSGVIVPLLRIVVRLPFAVLRGRRSRAVRIEAVNPYPVPEVLVWTTTEGQVEAVLDEIVAGLAEGKVVQPAGAVYSGSQTRR